MPSSFLLRHWKKELQVFHKNLLLLRNSSNSEAIHDLRVSVKKLRSYAKLYSALFKNEPTPFLAETKKLFSVLGKQRNIEISLELLHQFKPKELLPPIQKHFEFYLRETTQRSLSALQKYKADGLRSLTIEIEKTVSAIDDEAIKPRLLGFIRSSISEVRRQMKDFDKNYHLVRKKLKDIFYWSDILPADFFFSNQELKTLKSILDDLGNLQDYEVLGVNLQHYRKLVVAKGEAEYEAVKQFENSVDQEKKKLLGKSNEMVKKLLSQK